MIAKYIRLIKDEALKEIKNSTSGELKDQEIRWCLSIPAIWKNEDKDLMRRAARKAGLINSSDDEAERLFLVLEPEAAAIFCQEEDKNALTPGNKIMIIDCGGGTVDITVHKLVKDGGLDEVAPGTGGPFGSIYVDKSFQEYLTEKLSAEMVKGFHDQEPVDYLKMMEEWERTKCNFDPETSGDVIYFNIPTRLYNFISKRKAKILEQLADEQNGDDENIHLSYSTMENIFRITVHKLVKDGGLDEVAPGTGGPFGSIYVDKSFQEYLTEKLSAEMVKGFHDQEPVDYLKMMEEWERTKCNFDPETSGDVIYFNIPTRLYNFISKRKAKILEQLADEQNGDDKNIHLSYSTMENIFRPTLDGLVSTVKNQFKELGDEEVDIIFLVGGFSTSPVLRQRIKKEFGSKAKKIVMPPRPGVAILKGAASFGVAPGIIRARRSRLTYGVSSSREFNQFKDTIISQKQQSDNPENWENCLRVYKNNNDFLNWLLNNFDIQYSNHNHEQEKQQINSLKNALKNPKKLLEKFYNIYLMIVEPKKRYNQKHKQELKETVYLLNQKIQSQEILINELKRENEKLRKLKSSLLSKLSDRDRDTSNTITSDESRPQRDV